MSNIKTMYKLAIVGHGFVGKAIEAGFNCDSFIIDPKDYPENKISDLKNLPNLEMIFVAVPTPMSESGVIDSSIVESVIKEIDTVLNGKEIPIVLKSTVTPLIVDALARAYPTTFVYNPEFLTERNAVEDFLNPRQTILGSHSISRMNIVKRFYIDHSVDGSNVRYTEFLFMTPIEASLVKYGLNSFLASKVLWLNQFKKIVDAIGGDYKTVIAAMINDDRIGETHTSVPGPDGREGFGGACFTKDTAAFLRFSESLGYDFSVLKEVIKVNQTIRKQYTELDSREKEQNVSLDIKL